MNFLVPTYILSCILLFTSASACARESFQSGINGSIIQGSGTVVNGTFQYDGVENTWQQHYTGDFLYKNFQNVPIHTNADFGVKLDYKLADTYYLQAGARGEYDNLRTDPYSISTEFGVGYKFIHTNTMKLSNEFGIGKHIDKFGSSPIISNSLWFTWKITDRLTFSNKLLIERGWEKKSIGDDYYISNIAGLSCKLSPNVDLTIQQKYKKERETRTNVTLLGLALHF